jgi:hypothetical protein
MRTRRAGSVIVYSLCVLSGLLGVGLCCFFGFGELSSPGPYSLVFLLIAALMILLIAFGYRGIRERRRLGNEIWWQLLIIGLVGIGFLAFATLFILLCITLLSEGRSTIF